MCGWMVGRIGWLVDCVGIWLADWVGGQGGWLVDWVDGWQTVGGLCG